MAKKITGRMKTGMGNKNGKWNGRKRIQMEALSVRRRTQGPKEEKIHKCGSENREEQE